MPRSHPNIAFTDGVCSYCRGHDRSFRINENVLGEEKLAELLRSGGSAGYDCAVPVSGGKDSCYVLYYIVKKFGLKPLALFFDSGFTNAFAGGNVEKICRTLGVDLVTGRATEYRRELVREALLASRHLGKFVRICGNCENNIRTFAINESVKRNIPFIVWGYTDFEDNPAYFANENGVAHSKRYGTLGSMLRRMKKTFSTVVSQRAGIRNKSGAVYHGIRSLFHGIRDNIATGTPEGLRKFSPFLEVSLHGKKARSISFFDYIEYNPVMMVDILKREVGWESPKDRESRMDCMIHSLANFQNWKDAGITKDGFTYAVLVRNGFLSREEALKKEEILVEHMETECREFAELMDMDLGDLLTIRKA
jgi:hypothetical protein